MTFLHIVLLCLFLLGYFIISFSFFLIRFKNLLFPFLSLNQFSHLLLISWIIFQPLRQILDWFFRLAHIQSSQTCGNNFADLIFLQVLESLWIHFWNLFINLSIFIKCYWNQIVFRTNKFKLKIFINEFMFISWKFNPIFLKIELFNKIFKNYVPIRSVMTNC